jgi:hypothetical protein
MLPMIRLLLLPSMDFNRPAEEVLIDLIYISTKFKVNIHHIKFGLPMELDQRPDIDNDENTFINIKIDPLYDNRFSGANGVMYRRLPFEEVEVKVPMEIKIDHYPFFPEELLPQINVKYGLKLTVNDIDNTEHPSLDIPFKLKISPNSLIWIGALDPHLSFGGLDLAGLILNKNLNGYDRTGGIPLSSVLRVTELIGFESHVHPPLVLDVSLNGFKEYLAPP